MDLDASHFPSGQHDDCGFFPEDRVSKRAVRLRCVTIQVYAVIYLYAISFCHFTVGFLRRAALDLQPSAARLPRSSLAKLIFTSETRANASRQHTDGKLSTATVAFPLRH